MNKKSMKLLFKYFDGMDAPGDFWVFSRQSHYESLNFNTMKSTTNQLMLIISVLKSFNGFNCIFNK